MLLIMTATVFLLTLVLLVAVFAYLTRERQAVRARLAKYIDFAPTTTAPAAASPILSQQLAGWRAVIRRAGRYFEWARWSQSVTHKLLKAGLPLRGAEFAAICFATTMLGAFLFNSLGDSNPAGETISIGALLPGVAGALLGYLVPLFYLEFKIKQRASKFNAQLGDALVLVANSLRTGYSFLQAIELVAREMRSPLADEFARLLKEMSLGLTTEGAMANMAKRIDSDDLDLVVTAVLIQRQVGGNLAEVLDNIAGTIRERVKLKREIKTLTAQGRASGLIVGLLPFVLAAAIAFIAPEYLGQLFSHPVGQLMLGGAAVNMLFGLLWIRRIIDIRL